MSELNYKASNIARAERQYGLSFFKEVSNMLENPDSANISSLMFVLQAGGITEEEADEMFDTKGIVGAFEAAGEALADSGFLATMLKNPAVKKELEKFTKLTNQKPSPKAGDKTKV